MARYTHRLFGRIIDAPAPLPAPATAGSPDISLLDCGITEDCSTSEQDALSYSVQPDGTAVVTWLDRLRFTVPPNGSRIEFTYRHAADAPLMFDYLLAQALSVALLQQGIEPLHATVVATGERTIAFVGDCGSGKSTTAAALVASGARLLSDDLLVVDRPNGRVQPGARRIKLTQDVAARTIGNRAAVQLADDRAKWSYPLQPPEYCAEPRRLDRIYVLRGGSEYVCRGALARGEAMRELLAATFNPLEQRAERLQRHMQFTAELLENTSVQALQIPWDLDRLSETAGAIRELSCE